MIAFRTYARGSAYTPHSFGLTFLWNSVHQCSTRNEFEYKNGARLVGAIVSNVFCLRHYYYYYYSLRIYRLRSRKNWSIRWMGTKTKSRNGTLSFWSIFASLLRTPLRPTALTSCVDRTRLRTTHSLAAWHDATFQFLLVFRCVCLCCLRSIRQNAMQLFVSCLLLLLLRVAGVITRPPPARVGILIRVVSIGN